jgi:outer membrane protein OmpA-like peptidoglycan-associated protein
MKRFLAIALTLSFAVGLLVPTPARAERDLFERAPWNASAGIGYIRFEHDEEVKDGPFLMLRLGYDLSPRWTIEGDMDIMPKLKKRSFDNPGRKELDDDTWAVRIAVDLMFHLRNIDNMKWDPYLLAGAGFTHYGDSVDTGKTEGLINAGVGMFYHFNDAWALRLDLRGELVGSDTEANMLIGAGVNYRWGTYVPVEYAVTGGEIDSDGDGLLDTRESEIGTDPYDPDTDKDGLSDGQEVLEYMTDPLNADTDWDVLKDGAEVLTYQTNPLEPDTDNGGVADGHEVIEDHTNPLDPSDDLQLFTLNIEFDYDKANIRPIYYDQLDVIVKVLQRDPEATAKIEGHADKRPKSSRPYNLDLSKRRARAVRDYLVDVGGIETDRLTYEGYGFDRPVVPNTTEENMQLNRRTEIYIRGGHQQDGATGAGAPPEELIILDETVEPDAGIIDQPQDDLYPVK